MADDRRSGEVEVLRGCWSTRCLEIRDSRDDGWELPTVLMDLEGLMVLERGISATSPESVLGEGRSGCAMQASSTGSRELCWRRDLQSRRGFNGDTVAVDSLVYR